MFKNGPHMQYLICKQRKKYWEFILRMIIIIMYVTGWVRDDDTIPASLLLAVRVEILVDIMLSTICQHIL